MKKVVVLMLTMMFVLCGTVMSAGVPGSGRVEAAAAAGEKEYLSYIENTVTGGTQLGGITETITYSTRQSTGNIITNPALPAYTSSFTCGVTAGGVTIAYYNKTFTGLIPGHNAGTQIGNTWLWANGNVPAVSGMFSSLYTSMGGSMSGVTTTQYVAGMASYISGKGYNLSIVTGNSGSNGISAAFKTAIANNQVVTVFVDGFNLFGLGGLAAYPSQGYDTFFATEYAGAHVMAAYGYQEVKYLNANNEIFRTDTYILVNNGFSSLGYMRVNTHCTIDAAYVIQVS